MWKNRFASSESKFLFLHYFLTDVFEYLVNIL